MCGSVSDFWCCVARIVEKAVIQAPTFDYIPPESVSYFIMDTYAIHVMEMCI